MTAWDSCVKEGKAIVCLLGVELAISVYMLDANKAVHVITAAV